MSKWRAVMSGVSQGLVLVPVLVFVFVGDLDSGIECILSQFANDSTLCGVADILEGRDAIQRYLYKKERWTHANLRKFNKAKCKVLNMEWCNPMHKCRLGDK